MSQTAGMNSPEHPLAGQQLASYPGAPATVTAALAEGRTLLAPRWGIGDVVVTLAGTVVIAVLAGFALDSLADAGIEVDFGLATTITLVAPWLALAGWPALATRWRGNGPRIDLGIRMDWPDVRLGVIGGATVFLITAAIAAVMVAISGDVSSSAGLAAADLTENAGRLWVVLFGLLLFTAGPFVEELAFRGLVFAALRKAGARPWLAIAISAALFALLHFEPSRVALLLAAGVVFGILRQRTGALGAPIIAHALLNAPGAIITMAGLAGVTT